MSFNFFKILEKDDKELIHSSFLKFLISEDNAFAEKFLTTGINTTALIELEKSINFKPPGDKKKKKCKFDIFVEDENTVVVIENKFKSFPSVSQLRLYDECLENAFSSKNVKKILLSFDKVLNENYDGWEMKDYGELLPMIQEVSGRLPESDKKRFIDHYIYFLKEYYSIYEDIDNLSVKYLLNQNDKEAKFWVKLIYSKLALDLKRYFNKKSIDVTIIANPGNTSIPLLNIIPKHWRIDSKELLIQIQDGRIKFYAHSNDKMFLTELREFSKDKINNEGVNFRKDNLRECKTESIFSININNWLNSNSKLSHQEFLNCILQFYCKIDEKIIMKFKN